MTDFLDEKRREITERLKELKPLVDEFNRLEAAASALAGVGGSTASSRRQRQRTRRRGPGRPRGTGHAQKSSAPQSRHSDSSGAETRRANRGRPAKRRAGRAKAAARARPRRCRSCRVSRASRSPSWQPRWASSRTTCTACCPAWSRKKGREERPRLVPEGLKPLEHRVRGGRVARPRRRRLIESKGGVSVWNAPSVLDRCGDRASPTAHSPGAERRPVTPRVAARSAALASDHPWLGDRVALADRARRPRRRSSRARSRRSRGPRRSRTARRRRCRGSRR